MNNNIAKSNRFILKQINDIKTFGILELFRKFYIFIKIIPKFIVGIIALLPCIIIRLLEPLILIRIEKIPCVNFGDFASFPALYYCKKKLKIDQPSKRYLDLLYFKPGEKVSNQQLKKMWKRKLNFFSGHILHPINITNKLIPGWRKHSIEILSSKLEYDVDNLVEKYQPINFTSEEESKGRQILQKFGLKEGDKFVCLAVRDSAYNPKKNSTERTDFAYHDFRNHNIENFILAAEELTKRGYYVFRMGVIVNQVLNSDNSKIIDYPNSGLRSDFMDVYLGAKCSFCISTGYGFDTIPYIFKRPLGIMSLPVGDLRSHSDRFLLLTKNHFLKKEKRKLSLSEIFSHGLAFAYESSIFKKKGIELIDYTPEEIRDFAVEMYEIVESKKEFNFEDEQLQENFKRLFALNIKNTNYYAQVEKPYHKLQGQIRSRFSSKFLRENKDWLAKS